MRLGIESENRSRRGKSRIGQAQDIVQLICPLKDAETGEELVRVTSFSGHITLDRNCRKLKLMALDSEVPALISENSAKGDAVIDTGGSAVWHLRSAWPLMAQVGEKM